MTSKPTYIDFDHEKFVNKLNKDYDLRGEIGVLSYPFSKKMSAFWRFKTPDMATKSAKDISDFLFGYLQKTNNKQKSLQSRIYHFIKADICRKFLLMGYTRSMRYYYHRDGCKWEKTSMRGKDTWTIRPYDHDEDKKKSAQIFKKAHDDAYNSVVYCKALRWYKEHKSEIVFDASKIA